jgi:hypothetical protein
MINDKKEFIIKAAEKYWKKHNLDPINQTYYDSNKEIEIKEKETF